MKQIYCPDCDSYQPLYDEPPRTDRDGYAYSDLFVNAAALELRRFALPLFSRLT